jgi:hypothetical protein
MSQNRQYLAEYGRLQKRFYDELTVFYWIENGEMKTQPKVAPENMPGGKRLAD